MSWLYNGKPITEDEIEGHIGFVYLITHVATGKRYVGRKLFTFARTKSVKGKKKRVRVNSDWETYYGSSDNLQADIDKFGAENFSREILHLCANKGTCNYLELREIIDRRALELPDLYYNGHVQARVHRSHIKLSQ
jgi:hypothetical protein